MISSEKFEVDFSIFILKIFYRILISRSSSSLFSRTYTD